MSRFTMTLAAAAVSAVAAIAAIALPAVGADSKTTRQQAQAGGDVTAFASCLRSHGLADAPTDPAALKPWLGTREASDPAAVKAAMKSCDDELPAKPSVVEVGPDIKDVVACVRSHGLDAPTAPDAFKRWLQDAADPSAVDAALRDCKMSLGPGPSEGPAKPGGCGVGVQPGNDAKQGAAKEGAAKQGAAEPGI